MTFMLQRWPGGVHPFNERIYCWEGKSILGLSRHQNRRNQGAKLSFVTMALGPNRGLEQSIRGVSAKESFKQISYRLQQNRHDNEDVL